VTKKSSLQNVSERINLQLYVTGMTAKSMAAIRNVKDICEKHFKDKFDLEIIDLYKTPEAAEANQIIFSPSLIRIHPLPKKIIIGTFSNVEQVIRTLNIGLD
jgi:circadian clock protein KaiB